MCKPTVRALARLMQVVCFCNVQDALSEAVVDGYADKVSDESTRPSLSSRFCVLILEFAAGSLAMELRARDAVGAHNVDG